MNDFGVRPGRPLPANVVGIKGTPTAFEKAEAELGPLPVSFRITSPDEKLQIRFFRVPEGTTVSKFGLANFGLVLLAPGSMINERWKEPVGDSGP